MSFFKRDFEKEQLLGIQLDKIYIKIGLSLTRLTDINCQLKGIDLVYKHRGNDFFIDEKAQLDYLNKDLPTFTFELSYFKNGVKKTGWFLDDSKSTTHYFLVTGIHTNNKNDLSHSINKCKITSVNRKKLNNYLTSIGLSKKKLITYDKDIRASNTEKNKTYITELDNRNQGCLYYSPQLSERPVNLQLRLEFLIQENIAKRIYPITS